MDRKIHPRIAWAEAQWRRALADRRLGEAYLPEYRTERVRLPGKVEDESFRLAKQDGRIILAAAHPSGFLYGLLELADRTRRDDPALRGADWEFRDGPALRYRGYCLGLQRPVNYFPDHKSYDWPITPGHFPWFYDQSFLTRLLDRLAQTRCNALYLWSGHPFASLLKLADYPEAPEVDDAQLERNRAQYHWLCAEADRRGIWIVQKFYNIHMSDPLARKRGWDVMAGTAHPEISRYTAACLREFVRTYPSVGLMACLGEVLREEDTARWLEVILQGVREGLGPAPAEFPPVIIRAHNVNLEKYLPGARKLYPNLVTEMKHNNESFIATKPDSGNTVVARLSGRHIVNVHLCANLEPFTWGSPRFIRRTVANLLQCGACGTHVYPLRYWDWPHSAHQEPLGDQLHEHFIWWSAWGRYAWDPHRNESAEDAYWAGELKAEYGLADGQAAALLEALQETGPVLPQIAGQFTITSGNGQCVNLGQHLVTLAFSRQEFQDGGGYSMAQLCGFPLLGETLWTQSPVTRMERMARKCDQALARLKEAAPANVLAVVAREIEVMRLIARFYAAKARACALYFQRLYGVPGTDEAQALRHLEESVAIYREIVAQTEPFFRDASCLHHYRRLPVRVEDGYRTWKDVLPVFEAELATARRGGLAALLHEAAQKARPAHEWNAGTVDTDEI